MASLLQVQWCAFVFVFAPPHDCLNLPAARLSRQAPLKIFIYRDDTTDGVNVSPVTSMNRLLACTRELFVDIMRTRQQFRHVRLSPRV